MNAITSFVPTSVVRGNTDDCEAHKYYVEGNYEYKPTRKQDILCCVSSVSGQVLMFWCMQNPPEISLTQKHSGK